MEEKKNWHAKALQDLKTQQEQLAEEWRRVLLKESDIIKREEEHAQKVSAEEGRLAQLKVKVSLDAHEEDLVEREKVLVDKLRQKDEEIE
jgi:hypothetical protein